MIGRDPAATAEAAHDLVVVGGGVYGVAIAFEASRRGLRSVLVERGDFGGGVSGHSLRVVHGGLRYLQRLELGRVRVSAAERDWHLRAFPGLVVPLPCLMPLYGRGLKGPAVFRAALAAYARLTGGAMAGGVLGAAETAGRFEAVDRGGLRGGALWHDALMLSSERVLVEWLHRACDAGGRALNYVEAVGLEVQGGAVAGVEAVDRLTGASFRLRTGRVINAAGPWCGEVAGRFGDDRSALGMPSLGFNLLFDRRALAEGAVALEPRGGGGRTYFALNWRGRLLVGTEHLQFDGSPDDPRPSRGQVEGMIAGINRAVPGLDLDAGSVVRVFAGVLPAQRAEAAEMARRSVVVDHGTGGGPRGLVSVFGSKWTTARATADRLISRCFPGRQAVRGLLDDTRLRMPVELADGARLLEDRPRAMAWMREVVEQESVTCLADLVLRRLGGLEDRACRRVAAEMGAEVLGLPDDRRASAVGQVVAEGGLA